MVLFLWSACTDPTTPPKAPEPTGPPTSSSIPTPTPPETCNGLDDDGDGAVDEEAVDAVDGWVDLDGDGYGTTETTGCPGDEGLADQGGDCDDLEPAVHPGAPELCNTHDDDCDPATVASCSGCVWVGDGADVYRYSLDGTLQDEPGCGFVGIGPDGVLYFDGGQGVGRLDPSCAPMDELDIPDLPIYGPDYVPHHCSFYEAVPEVREVTVAPDGDLYVLYVFDRGGPWYYLQMAAVDRYTSDGTFVSHVYRVEEAAPHDIAVAGDGWLYVATAGGIVRADPADPIDPVYYWPYFVSTPFVAAGEGGLEVPTRLETGPDGSLHVLDSTGAVLRFDPAAGSVGEVLIEATSPSRTDLLILADEGVLLLTDAGSSSIEAFDAATGASLGAWAAGVPTSFDARLALGPCPAP